MLRAKPLHIILGFATGSIYTLSVMIALLMHMTFDLLFLNVDAYGI